MRTHFIRMKDRDGTQHFVKPSTITRLSESLPPNDPPSVHVFIGEHGYSIKVMGSLDDVFKQLELYS